MPEEPARLTTGVVNIVIRVPCGDRIERKFLATDPIQVCFLYVVFHGWMFLLSCIILCANFILYIVECYRHFGLSLPVKFKKIKNLCSSVLRGDWNWITTREKAFRKLALPILFLHWPSRSKKNVQNVWICCYIDFPEIHSVMYKSGIIWKQR